MEGSEVQQLKDELQEAEEKITKAAMFGTMLLEENEDLKSRMDELRKSTDKKLELVEQEKHGFQVKLDQKCSMENWYNEEISHLKQQLAEGQVNLRDTLEADKIQEVTRLTRQIDELRVDQDHASSTESQLRQTITELEALLQEKLNKTVMSPSKSFNTSEELSELQEEVQNLQNEVTGLKSQLIEKKSKVQSTIIEMDNLRAKVIARDEELEEIQCQFTTVNNALEQARVEKLDLKCQLDALRMETSGHNKKGNSIFSELDDRRVDAEKKLISLNVANETLKEKYNVEKQQNQKYKRQISQLLLQMSSGRVDSEYVVNLESKLSQARQEVRSLIEEKSQLQEKRQAQEALMTDIGQKQTGEGGDYVKYLVTLIEGKDGELQKKKQELSFKTLQLLDEKSRTSTQESKIIQLDAEKDKLRSHNMKLALKVEELKLKYEPESVKKSGVLVVKRTEKIPLDNPDEVKITETSRIHDNSTVNQSQVSHQAAEVTQSNHLTEKIENIPVKSTFLSKSVKTKSVSISDEIEEHEIENTHMEEEESDSVPKLKQKGRRLTEVKRVTKDSSKQSLDVNQCKNQ